MFHKVLRISALVAAIALAVAVTFGGKVSAIFQGQPSASQTTTRERKVLYWYDAMSPQHHYDKPGKAPDGMDLVPQYAEDNAAQSASPASTSAPSGERKILYWYDPMTRSIQVQQTRKSAGSAWTSCPNIRRTTLLKWQCDNHCGDARWHRQDRTGEAATDWSKNRDRRTAVSGAHRAYDWSAYQR